jgi:hypothetical protein
MGYLAILKFRMTEIIRKINQNIRKECLLKLLSLVFLLMKEGKDKGNKVINSKNF